MNAPARASCRRWPCPAQIRTRTWGLALFLAVAMTASAYSAALPLSPRMARPQPPLKLKRQKVTSCSTKIKRDKGRRLRRKGMAGVLLALVTKRLCSERWAIAQKARSPHSRTRGCAPVLQTKLNTGADEDRHRENVDPQVQRVAVKLWVPFPLPTHEFVASIRSQGIAHCAGRCSAFGQLRPTCLRHGR